jgi:hypothetical protein
LTVRALVVSPVRENVSSPVIEPSREASGELAVTVTDERVVASAALVEIATMTAAATQNTDRAARPAAMSCVFRPAILQVREKGV